MSKTIPPLVSPQASLCCSHCLIVQTCVADTNGHVKAVHAGASDILAKQMDAVHAEHQLHMYAWELSKHAFAGDSLKAQACAAMNGCLSNNISCFNSIQTLNLSCTMSCHLNMLTTL